MQKTSGILLIIAGLMLGGYAMTMDTSVSTSQVSEQLNLPDIPNYRVNNLGLMRTQQNCLLIGMIAFISGIILVACDSENIEYKLDAITNELKEIKKSLQKDEPQPIANKVTGQTEVTESNIKDFEKNS